MDFWALVYCQPREIRRWRRKRPVVALSRTLWFWVSRVRHLSVPFEAVLRGDVFRVIACVGTVWYSLGHFGYILHPRRTMCTVLF